MDVNDQWYHATDTEMAQEHSRGTLNVEKHERHDSTRELTHL